MLGHWLLENLILSTSSTHRDGSTGRVVRGPARCFRMDMPHPPDRAERGVRGRDGGYAGGGAPPSPTQYACSTGVHQRHTGGRGRAVAWVAMTTPPPPDLARKVSQLDNDVGAIYNMLNAIQTTRNTTAPWATYVSELSPFVPAPGRSTRAAAPTRDDWTPAPGLP